MLRAPAAGAGGPGRRAGRGRGGRRAGSRLRGAAPLQCPGSPGGGDGGARRQQRGSPAETIAGRAAAPRPAAPAARAPRPGPMAGPAAPWAALLLLLLAALLAAALPGTGSCRPTRVLPAGVGRGGAAERGAQGRHGPWGWMPSGAALCPARHGRHRWHSPAEPVPPVPAQAPAAVPVCAGTSAGATRGRRDTRAGRGAAKRGKTRQRGSPGSRRAAGTLRGLARCGSAAFGLQPVRTLVTRREQVAPEGDSLPLAFSPWMPFPPGTACWSHRPVWALLRSPAG